MSQSGTSASRPGTRCTADPTDPADRVLAPVAVNGALGLVLYDDGKVDTVVSFTVAAGLVHRIDFVRAPDKLR